MVASLLHLRTMLANLAGRWPAPEPVIYRSHRGVGAQWPCGCIGYGGGFEQLEIVLCKEHYRVSLAQSVAAARDRRRTADRRRSPRRVNSSFCDPAP